MPCVPGSVDALAQDLIRPGDGQLWELILQVGMVKELSGHIPQGTGSEVEWCF